MKDELRDEVLRVKENIREVVPRGTNIEIKLEEESRGVFETLIRIKVPGKKSLLAFKREYDPKVCLYKGYQAILRQISKMRMKSQKVRLPKVAA